MTSSDSALEQLISQFAQPLAFLRELIQNSLDASTALIEVDVAYDQESKCCSVTVRDNGHGMNRDIIDRKLTKLFSSTKENDLTKIGKFGIGFVSIFAINPKLVVLETGQDGESWRVLFLPDRSFERREMSVPVEGTSVTVFTSKGLNQLAQLQKDCRETVSFWCKHSDVEILFNGTPINESFDLPGRPYQFRHKVTGTEAVVSPCLHRDGFHGYYNRGLTLLEGVGSPLPHVDFKLRSRYLEHTLSRDNILHDSNYEKAMAQVRLAAFSMMPRDLFRQLGESGDDSLWKLAGIVMKYPENVASKVQKIKIFPTRGKKLSLKELPKLLYHAEQVDDLWEAVEASGETIIFSGEERLKFLYELFYDVVSLESAFFHYQPAQDLSEQEEALLGALPSVCRHLARPFLVDSLNTPYAWKDTFCAYLHPKKAVDYDPAEKKRWREWAGLRREHPFWSKVVALYAAQPELALSLTVRMMGLQLGGKTKPEGRLFHSLVKSVRKRVPAVEPS